MKIKEQKKNKILKAGYQLFEKFGYNGTGINDIIKLAGVPKGSFYYYFKNKENFAVEVIHFYLNQLIASDKVQNSNDFDARKVLFKRYDHYIQNLVESKGLQYDGFASKLLQETRETSKRIKEASNQVFDLMFQNHVFLLKKIFPANYPEHEIRIKAEMIIFAWEGAILRMKSLNSHQSLFDFKEMLSFILNEK